MDSKIAQLRELFGDRCLTDDSTLRRHSRDQVGDKKYEQTPIAVVQPTSCDEVVSLVQWANAQMVPITARGGGSGLAGAAIPAKGGVVCSFSMMNRVLSIDTENLMVTLEPGVITAALDKTLAEHGLFFAGYPMSEEICTIGGNVGENAGGGRAIKYGVTGNYLLGAEVVTPTGVVLDLGGPRLKDVTGYNLLPLFLGSEGTLGLFTRITLRLVPRPAARGVVLCGFRTAGEAAKAVIALRGSNKASPSAIEFIDGPTARETNAALASSDRTDLPAGVDALVLAEVDGETPEVRQKMEYATSLLKSHGGAMIQAGTDETSTSRAWKLRKQIPWYVKRRSGDHHSLEDVVVPPARITELVALVEELRKRFGVPIALFGHAGDGNFHATPMKPEEMSEDEWAATLEQLLTALYDEVVRMGGTISGEHGIGRKRARHLAHYLQPEQLETMRAIKRLLDPNNVLNPGVVFPE